MSKSKSKRREGKFIIEVGGSTHISFEMDGVSDAK